MNEFIAGIGVDITEVINELGATIEILEKENSPIYEKIDYESNTQVTKPFSVEVFLLTTFTHTSVVETGDLLNIPAMGNFYRVMNVFNEIFEDKVIYKQCVLYKCNTVATVYHPEDMRDPKTQQATQMFVLREGATDIRCLLTDKLYGSRLDDETQPLIQMDIRGRIAYLPKALGIESKDRFVFTTEHMVYEATVIENNTFPGISIVYLEEDTRVNVYKDQKTATKVPVPLLP